MKLNLGCGKDYKRGYTNMDANPDIGVDMCHDALEGLPFRDNTIDEVYTSHFLEHIPQVQLFALLDEIYRVCKPGARFVVIVPHYSTAAAHTPVHHTTWGSESFKTCESGFGKNHNEERYTRLRVHVERVRLYFWMRHGHALKVKVGLWMLDPAWLWNFAGFYGVQFWERFQPFGFDDNIYRAIVATGGSRWTAFKVRVGLWLGGWIAWRNGTRRLEKHGYERVIAAHCALTLEEAQTKAIKGCAV
jgi:SAM-dependent methyltransferase